MVKKVKVSNIKTETATQCELRQSEKFKLTDKTIQAFKIRKKSKKSSKPPLQWHGGVEKTLKKLRKLG